ncbi:MAG: amino acid adenylation domain-containing protein [Gammaproteobacteria bacterium]|nr:amino acid adenylation domain-containing protein [Gammaproteobacteria bacterium]
MTINIKKTLPLLFEQQAKQRAQHIALVSDQETLTYQQLNERANQLAHYLKHLGTAPETLVALHLGRSTQAIVTILAIFKAGGAYLPLDCNDPIQRLQFILNESQATFLISQSRADLPTGLDESITILILDELDEILKQQPVTNPTASAKMHNLAYVMYTSGSTGKPKGVEIEHRGIPNLIAAQITPLQLTANDRILQFAALHFDASVFEIWTALLFGISLYCPQENLRSDPPKLNSYICRHQITVALLPPILLTELPQNKNTPLKTLIIGGDICSKQIMDNWRKICHVINAYGPTENTVITTMFTYDGKLNQCIGLPIRNTQCYILNEKKEITRPGEVGELYIEGIGLARGYRNKSQLTAKKFILWTLNGKTIRLYRSGDQVRSLPNGHFEYIGRLDFQIKFNGIRIEPGEIEMLLNNHSTIHQSLVILRKHKHNEYLVAYIVLKEGKKLSINQAKNHLRKYLSFNKTPNFFVFIKNFPLLSTGKINRSALPKPEFTDSRKNFSLLSRQEKILAILWSDVLEISQDAINLNSDFFSLGGTSLQATRLVSAINQEKKLTIDITDIFENPILGKMALRLENLSNIQHESALEIKHHGNSLPLSFPQKRLWLAYQAMNDQCRYGYNVHLILKFDGKLNSLILQHALQHLVNRHEILRTYFPKVGIQKIKEVTIQLFQQRLTQSNPDNSSNNLKAIIKQACQHDFGDLSKPPLLYPLLIEVKKNEYLLILVFHHIIIDALSIPILIRELSAFYNHAVNEKKSTLPKALSKLSVQYADFFLWQRQQLETNNYNESFSYWKKQLNGATNRINLPMDKSRPKQMSYRGHSYIFSLPKTVTNRLQSLAKQQHVTLFNLILSSIAVLLYRYNHQEDIIIGVSHSERPLPIFNQLIGFFVNMLPIRINQSEKLSFTEILQQTQRTLTQAYKHNAPLEEIIDQLKLSNHTSSTCHPLFQVSITMHNMPPLDINFTGLTTTLWEKSLLYASNTNSAKFDLSFEIEKINDGRLAIKIEYSDDLFFSETIKQMARNWKQLCRSIISQPSTTINRVPLLSSKQQKNLLEKWEKQPPCHPGNKTILQTFNEQVQQRADTIAIIDGDISYTYNELNKQSNRLAHYLLSLQDFPEKEKVIAIALERSANFIISALAILKTGSAYLPIDLALSTKRLQFMLDDASVKIVIANDLFKERFQQSEINIFSLEEDRIKRELQKQPTTDLTKSILPNNLAYIIYTSGSTGKPKGVMIEHHSIVQLVKNPNYVELSPNDTVIQIISISFDLSTFEIWGALLNGAKAVICPKSTLMNTIMFKEILKQNKVTVMILPTILFYRLLLIDHTVFNGLKWLLFCGEKLMNTKAIQPLLSNEETMPKHIINIYGPAENTVYSLSFDLVINKWIKGEIPIGKTIQTTTAYILDRNQQPVAPGIPGELYVGGVGLARGYLNRKALTKEKFILNPFTKGKDKLYRTGDLVYYKPNGNVVFISRVDYQVKISGHRIELGEIENTLLSFDGIKEAIVIKNHDEKKENLIAYIVPNKNTYKKYEQNTKELRKSLSESLPYYMIPETFIPLNALPLNVNGKVDRKQLPKPEINTEEHDHNYPENETEKWLERLWKEVLSLSREISTTEDFFNLGGKSLLAMQLTAMINKKFDDISYSSLLSHHTIKSQAKLIDSPSHYRTKKTLTVEYIQKETILNKNIVPNNEIVKPVGNKRKAALLTGVTGFLGIFLLDEIMRETNTKVYCLIRANNQLHAKKRLHQTIEKYKVDNFINDENRIELVIGDIGEEFLGLKQAEYSNLAKEIDIIYHSASAVNFITPYSALRHTNVLGTKNLLHFSVTERMKPLHYISSVAVFSFAHYFHHKSLLLENMPLWTDAFSRALPKDLGYMQSKFVAESLVWEARNRGVPVVIHRPGFILCDSRKGIGNIDQMWAKLIKDCLTLKHYPDLTDFKAELTTVDYVSQVIVEISKQSDCIGKIFHIVPSIEYNLTTNTMFSMVKYKGNVLIKEPFPKWRKRLKSHIASGHVSELELLLPLFTDSVNNGLSLLEVYQNSPHFSRENTENALRNSQIVELPLEPAIIERYIAWLMGYSR